MRSFRCSCVHRAWSRAHFMISRPRVLVVCHSYAAADRVSVIAVVGIVNVPQRERTVWPRLATVDALLFFCGRVSRGHVLNGLLEPVANIDITLCTLQACSFGLRLL